MSKRTASYASLAKALLAMFVLGMAACSRQAPEPAAQGQTSTESKSLFVRVAPALLESGRVTVAKVEPFTFAGAVVVPGTVASAADGEAEVGSLVAGRIASLESAEGAQVKKGQVLAWLDSPEVGATRADLARATVKSTSARRHLERQLSLQSQGATSQSAVDEAQAADGAAQAEQRATLAKLGSMGVAGERIDGRIPLRSPIDGTVVSRNVTLGASVTANAPVFRVVNLRRLFVKAQWPERHGMAPLAGSVVQLIPRRATLGAQTSTACSGKLVSHLGVIDPATRSMTLQIDPDQGCNTLTPGAYLDVLISTANSSQPTGDCTGVPFEALVDLRGAPTVFVAADEPGVFEVRPVAPRPMVGDVVPIDAGLRPGERVAVKGILLLKGEALRDVLGGE